MTMHTDQVKRVGVVKSTNDTQIFGFTPDTAVVVIRDERSAVLYRDRTTTCLQQLSDNDIEMLRALCFRPSVDQTPRLLISAQSATLLNRLITSGHVRCYENASAQSFDDRLARHAHQMDYYHLWTEQPLDTVRSLQARTVLVLGLGGLGSELIRHLSSAGIGRLILVDPDHVELSNLNRQHCYAQSSVGVPKTLAMRQYLAIHAPNVTVLSAERFIDNEEHLRHAVKEVFGTDDPRCDMVCCCADTPVGRVELACLGFARRLKCACAFTGMHVRRGYWSVLTDQIAMFRAADLFKTAVTYVGESFTGNARASASWENAVIGGHFAEVVLRSLAGYTHGAVNTLVEFDFSQMRSYVLQDFASRPDVVHSQPL